MLRKNADSLFKELRSYLHYFPYNYLDRVFEIFSHLPKSEAKDSVLKSYLKLISEKKNAKGQLLLEYVETYEKLFFFLSDEKIKTKYSNVLLDVYLVRFSDNEKLYKKKIQKVQEFLGKEITDLPQFKKEKSFLQLHLGPKKIFSLISKLLSGEKNS